MVSGGERNGTRGSCEADRGQLASEALTSGPGCVLICGMGTSLSLGDGWGVSDTAAEVV